MINHMRQLGPLNFIKGLGRRVNFLSEIYHNNGSDRELSSTCQVIFHHLLASCFMALSSLMIDSYMGSGGFMIRLTFLSV